ncbi:MAG: tail fiber domain-containing protein, partial [Bacteroidota bacterium]
YGLESILKMNPVSYNWKNNPGENKKLGLIAQELQEVIPEAVYKGETEEDYMGVNYSDLIPVLIKAIQDQNDKIQLLEAEIKELKIDVQKE